MRYLIVLLFIVSCGKTPPDLSNPKPKVDIFESFLMIVKDYPEGKSSLKKFTKNTSSAIMDFDLNYEFNETYKVGSTNLFFAKKDDNYSLWKTDGTTVGTTILLDTGSQGTCSPSTGPIIFHNENVLVFQMYNVDDNSNVYITDGDSVVSLGEYLAPVMSTNQMRFKEDRTTYFDSLNNLLYLTLETRINNAPSLYELFTINLELKTKSKVANVINYNTEFEYCGGKLYLAEYTTLNVITPSSKDLVVYSGDNYITSVQDMVCIYNKLVVSGRVHDGVEEHIGQLIQFDPSNNTVYKFSSSSDLGDGISPHHLTVRNNKVIFSGYFNHDTNQMYSYDPTVSVITQMGDYPSWPDFLAKDNWWGHYSSRDSNGDLYLFNSLGSLVSNITMHEGVRVDSIVQFKEIEGIQTFILKHSEDNGLVVFKLVYFEGGTLKTYQVLAIDENSKG